MKKIDVKVPSFLNDLYRDLRDRHLLIPALGLIVALVAVPMVLGEEKKPLPPPPPPPTATEAAATSPAVLADTEVSVRDYRKRLEALKSKNPFEQKFVIPAQPLTDSSATGTAPTDTSGLPPSSTNAGGAVGTTSLPDPPAGVTTDNTSGDSDDGDTRVVNQLFVRRVDVMVGIQGDTRSRKNVKPMTVLPNNDTPVAAYLGTDEAGKRAAFAVSSDVSSVGGDGACVPSPGCLFLTLEKGETATFDYEPDGQTYELTLRAIRNVKVKTD